MITHLLHKEKKIRSIFRAISTRIKSSKETSAKIFHIYGFGWAAGKFPVDIHTIEVVIFLFFYLLLLLYSINTEGQPGRPGSLNTELVINTNAYTGWTECMTRTLAVRYQSLSRFERMA